MLKNWTLLLTRTALVLWGLQILWLGWHFYPEARDLAWRLAHHRSGAAVRQEDQLYRWYLALAAVIPPQAAYIFLDDYESGKEIEARYHLAPRRHILLPPGVPAGFLFYQIRQEQASFVLIRDKNRPRGPGEQALDDSSAFQRLDVPGPGSIYRVDFSRLRGGFDD